MTETKNGMVWLLLSRRDESAFEFDVMPARVKTKLHKQSYTPYFKSPSLLDLAGRLRDTLTTWLDT